VGRCVPTDDAVTAKPHRFPLGAFSFADGTTLNDAELVYTTYGSLNDARDNVIVWPTWFTGTHVDHEWMVGQDDALDTREYFLVIPGMFGNGLSSSPTNTPPPFDRARFPHHTIQDNVRAQHRLLVERFDVQGIQLVIGGSIGAFQSFQWALSHPELVQRIMPCCGASRVSPHCYVFLEGVKAALLADAAYAGGDYQRRPRRVCVWWAASSPDGRSHRRFTGRRCTGRWATTASTTSSSASGRPRTSMSTPTTCSASCTLGRPPTWRRHGATTATT
jgi:homoserine acetyltransferase